MATSKAPADFAVRSIEHAKGAVTVIEFRDRRLIDPVHIEKLGKQILELIAKQRTPRVVLSFKSVEFLSSTALNALIQIENAIRQKKGQFRLADLDAQLQKVFTMMKLQKVMPIVDSTEEAVKSLDS